MILGIGSDICDIRRIERLYGRFGEAFLHRVFTRTEIENAGDFTDPQRIFGYYAKRYAAKEACAKALGSGVGSQVAFRQMEILRQPNGKPVLRLLGEGLSTLNALTPPGMRAKIDVSLSDDYPMALAFVVISAVYVQ